MEALVNTYKELEKIKVPPDQQYVIYAYFLYSEPKDGVYGKQIYLGAYSRKKALKKVKKIIKATGHDCIYVTKACNWEDIDERKHPDRTIYLTDNRKDLDLDEQFKSKILKRQQDDEDRDRISKELDQQLVDESDPTTVEYYAHNWFNAIRNKAMIEYHKEQVKHYEEHYNKRIEKIRTQYKNQPEVEEKWLPIYKVRLEARKEKDVYSLLEQGHKQLRDEVLTNEKVNDRSSSNDELHWGC